MDVHLENEVAAFKWRATSSNYQLHVFFRTLTTNFMSVRRQLSLSCPKVFGHEVGSGRNF